MTIATYGARVNVHPDRKGAFRATSAITLLVVHTSEQAAESTSSAEALARYLEAPGDRATSGGGMYGSSYHAITDTDRVLPAVPDNVVAYAAGGGNHQGLHVCIPGKASQTVAQWNDAVTGPMVEQCARWLADKATEYSIPVRKLNAEQVRGGTTGICGHVDVSNAFRKSDHGDPGPSFPWGSVIARVVFLVGEKDGKADPPPPKFPTDGGSVLVAFYQLSGKPFVYGVFTGGTKIWYPDPASLKAAQALARLAGKDSSVKVTTDPGMLAAFGPIVGPVPPGVDPWGR